MTVRELIELLLPHQLDHEVQVWREETIGSDAGAHATSTILNVLPGDGTAVGITLPRRLQ